MNDKNKRTCCNHHSGCKAADPQDPKHDDEDFGPARLLAFLLFAAVLAVLAWIFLGRNNTAIIVIPDNIPHTPSTHTNDVEPAVHGADPEL